VVERAYRRPLAVGECVRAMIAGVVERFADVPDAAFAAAVQESSGTIHSHHLTADRGGLLGQLRRELRTGEPVARQTSMRGWLEADLR
jgi:GTP cyclohydrolase IV